jgi:uncharacterized membrane protein YebE (DUF533 family)
MLADLFLGSMIRSALGVHPRTFFGAPRYVGGGIPGIGMGMNLGTLIGAAGLAWGAYEHFKDRTPSVMTTVEGGGFASSSPPPIPRASPATSPPALSPSIPAAADAPAPSGPDALRRLVALSFAAARADGDLGEEEYGEILRSAREHNAVDLVREELDQRRSLQEIVAGANDPKLRSDLYGLAYGIVRADGSVSPAERKWLHELASALSLDSESASRIEQETADRIAQHVG